MSALVPLAQTAPQTGAVQHFARQQADFLAQLIATAIDMPQTRARRRAAPAEAASAYATLGHWPSPAGRALSRAL